jgi:FtsP/CotA-like multicopper oxidase with cupredoxin domain
MLAAFMGCAGDSANQRAASSPSPGGTSLTDQQEVQTTFRTEQRQPFQPPPELISQNGLLETTFDVQPMTFTVAGAEVRGYAYQGQFIDPTLRVLPGDTVRVQLRNRLNEPTNLHSHVMFVPPIGISDNVLLQPLCRNHRVPLPHPGA